MDTRAGWFSWSGMFSKGSRVVLTSKLGGKGNRKKTRAALFVVGIWNLFLKLARGKAIACAEQLNDVECGAFF